MQVEIDMDEFLINPRLAAPRSDEHGLDAGDSGHHIHLRTWARRARGRITFELPSRQPPGASEYRCRRNVKLLEDRLWKSRLCRANCIAQADSVLGQMTVMT